MRLSPTQIRELLHPYLEEPATDLLCEKIGRYLELLKHWNSRVNLTAVRAPEQAVQRHFGESLLMARHLPAFRTLLDFGSGAGFPGLPIAMAFPDSQVTMGESHAKKAAFLREAAWMVGTSATVFADRVEKMPEERVFDVVTLRAVDMMQEAMNAAVLRVRAGGVLAFFAAQHESVELPTASWLRIETVPMPQNRGKIVLAHRE